MFYICGMEKLKIDRTKLMTIKNYADSIGFTPQRIYQLAKESSSGIKIVEIDGVKFIEKD